MPAGDVSGFVGEHSDDLVRGLCLHQRADIDEDASAVGHECVERTIIDDDDPDILLRQPGHAQDGLGIIAQHLLDLRIADDRQAPLRILRACRADGNDHCRRGDERDTARGWRPAPLPVKPSAVRHDRIGFLQKSGAS